MHSYSAMAPLCSQSLRVANCWSSFFHILHLSTVRGRIRQRETRVQVSQSPPLTSLDWRDMETSLLKQYTSPFLWQSSTSIHIRQSMHNTQVCNHGCRPTEEQLVPCWLLYSQALSLQYHWNMPLYRLDLHELQLQFTVPDTKQVVWQFPVEAL